MNVSDNTLLLELGEGLRLNLPRFAGWHLETKPIPRGLISQRPPVEPAKPTKHAPPDSVLDARSQSSWEGADLSGAPARSTKPPETSALATGVGAVKDRKALADSLREITKQVQPPPGSPWETKKKAKRVRSLFDLIGTKDQPRRFDHALRLWASTPAGGVWETTLGKGIAEFALSRYWLVASEQKIDKLDHAATVLWYTMQIQEAQASSGFPLDARWQSALEYAALLHDIGYLHGWRFHSGTGGADVLGHLNPFLVSRGIPPLSQEDLERVACIVELHGTAFPWDKVDHAIATEREAPGDYYLAGPQFLDLKLALQLMSGKEHLIGEALRQENSRYLKEPPLPGQEAKLKFLDDPAELRQLLIAGWAVHSGDRESGPLAPGADGRPVEAPERQLGWQLPIQDLTQLEAWKEEERRKEEERKKEEMLQASLARGPVGFQE